MKHLLIAFATLVLSSCHGQLSNESNSKNSVVNSSNQEDLKNEKIRNYKFLDGMYSDSYYPKFLVDKIKIVLIEFCFDIERSSPKSLDELYKLSHEATQKFNDLQDEFSQKQSEIETDARELIARDFDFISNAYGFKADIEELISNRDW